MNATEIQNAINNDAYVYITAGNHIIDSIIELDGTQEVVIESHPKGKLIWTGPSGSGMFTFTGEGGVNSQKVEFDHVWAETTGVIGSPIFKLGGLSSTPHYMTFKDCRFATNGAYCIDVNRSPYIITPVFKNMRTSGGGAIRFKSRTGGNDPYHTTSLMVIDTWHHSGNNRVGPAFNFRGTSGLRMLNIVDKGSPSLREDLRNIYAGPVSFRIDSCRTPLDITNYIVEYSEDFTNASGCWLHEFRSDNGNGTGKQEYIILRNMTLRDNNIPTGIRPTHIMGGNESNHHSVVCDIVACEDVSADDLLIGGRCWVRAEQIWYNPGQTEKYDSLQQLLDGLISGSFRDPIVTSTGSAPVGMTGTLPYVPGEYLYDNWTGGGTGEYEEILSEL